MSAMLRSALQARVDAFEETRTRRARMTKRPASTLRSKWLRTRASVAGAPVRTKARTFWGETMNIVVPEPVSMAILEYGFIEEGLTSMLIDELRPGDVFFDVGAHFGYYSLLGASLVGAEGAVHSFEPTPSTREMLISNTSRCPSVTTVGKAAWSSSTNLELSDFGPEMSAFNTLKSARHESAKLSATRVRVETISLDEYQEQTGATPDFVKIDAENAEVEILSGMATLLRDSRPSIAVEVGDVGDEAGGSRMLIDRLSSYDYVPFEFSRGRVTEHTPRETYAHDNLLFKPRERVRNS